ncbi:hypothetical protein PWEIH_09803 [Listeria weihenstephanensis FSL R9-0317]|uniref:Uncharacterized protein n=1 Tax=Listeria weihenstephanensis TaxID=1006155 RepID=A0A1S7FY44_9LIST|nr:hypothetical protein UE46_15740 [Listeria weihenstephanensis]EUJ38282.1 hypothetical protein PWEIH_09803 [Listeria weihenstephanensis FSL R9-0317]
MISSIFLIITLIVWFVGEASGFFLVGRIIVSLIMLILSGIVLKNVFSLEANVKLTGTIFIIIGMIGFILCYRYPLVWVGPGLIFIVLGVKCLRGMAR